MIKYLGSKRRLLPELVSLIAGLDGVRVAVDLFSGTSRVGQALKRAGLRVRSNDHNAYAATLARCYVAADRERWEDEARGWLQRLSALPPAEGWFTRSYCEEARFLQPRNGARVQAMRDAIAAAALAPELEAILLTSLLEAADRVDSTIGVQMAYLKAWAPRSFRQLELRLPELLPSVGAPCEAHQMDALQAARALTGDVAYLDPPYNGHKYLGNYHVWETLVLWDDPPTYGKVRKRADCRTRGSAFNRVREIRPALEAVVDAIDARWLVVSCSDEGFLTREAVQEVLERRGPVSVAGFDMPRHVGARIGIHSPSGERVGTVSHVRNTEYVFVVGPTR